MMWFEPITAWLLGPACVIFNMDIVLLLFYPKTSTFVLETDHLDIWIV